LAVGLALGGYFVGQTMYNAKVALNTAEAKGLAERRVKADRANLYIDTPEGISYTPARNEFS
jgi:hypothetical protein